MISFVEKRKSCLLFKAICCYVALTFVSTLMCPFPSAQAQSVLNLPIPGTMVSISEGFTPVIVKGISIYHDNPLHFDFIVDTGDTGIKGEALKEESSRLIKYFLASLTVPEENLWVNLSPYEQDRIIPEEFGVTEMGRDLLAQDYMLKQLMASLSYPESGLGKQFWSRIYKKAYELYGTTDIPLNTFNKVWIIPEKAVVYEHNGKAFVVERHLKVMLEQDYLALQRNLESVEHGMNKLEEGDLKAISGVSAEVVREVLLPEIEKEVNTGETFANLRQIFNSMILATWYKKNLKESLLGQVYADKNKTKGVDVEDKDVKEKIYDQYLEAFKTGVYDFIKEDYDEQMQEVIPRKYFSGGVVGSFALAGGVQEETDYGMLSSQQKENLQKADGSIVTLETELFSIGPEGDLEAAKQGKFAGLGKNIAMRTTEASEIARKNEIRNSEAVKLLNKLTGISDELKEIVEQFERGGRTVLFSTGFGAPALTDEHRVWIDSKLVERAENSPREVDILLSAALINELQHDPERGTTQEEFEEEVRGIQAEAAFLNMMRRGSETNLVERFTPVLKTVYGNLDGIVLDEFLKEIDNIFKDEAAARLFVAGHYLEHAEAILFGQITHVTAEERLAALNLILRLPKEKINFEVIKRICERDVGIQAELTKAEKAIVLKILNRLSLSEDKKKTFPVKFQNILNEIQKKREVIEKATPQSVEEAMETFFMSVEGEDEKDLLGKERRLINFLAAKGEKAIHEFAKRIMEDRGINIEGIEEDEDIAKFFEQHYGRSYIPSHDEKIAGKYYSGAEIVLGEGGFVEGKDLLMVLDDTEDFLSDFAKRGYAQKRGKKFYYFMDKFKNLQDSLDLELDDKYLGEQGQIDEKEIFKLVNSFRSFLEKELGKGDFRALLEDLEKKGLIEKRGNYYYVTEEFRQLSDASKLDVTENLLGDDKEGMKEKIYRALKELQERGFMALLEDLEKKGFIEKREDFYYATEKFRQLENWSKLDVEEAFLEGDEKEKERKREKVYRVLMESLHSKRRDIYYTLKRGLDKKRYPVPSGESQYKKERLGLMAELVVQGALGRKVVETVGIGHVSTAMLTVTADTVINTEERELGPEINVETKYRRPLKGEVHPYYALGYQRPGRSSLRMHVLNEGRVPISTEDRTVDEKIADGIERGNLRGTFLPMSMAVADVILVDTEVDVLKRDKQLEFSEADVATTRRLIEQIGKIAHKDALIVIESTTFPGFTRNVVFPILFREYAKRGLITLKEKYKNIPLEELPEIIKLVKSLEEGKEVSLNDIKKAINDITIEKLEELLDGLPKVAYSPQVLQPGPEWLQTLRKFPKFFAALTKAARKDGEEYFRNLGFDYHELATVEEAEFIKVLDNSSFDALLEIMNAFMKAAEELGIDGFKIARAIAEGRPVDRKYITIISQLMRGGYCIPKDMILMIEAMQKYYGVSEIEVASIFMTRLAAATMNDFKAKEAITRHVIEYAAKRGIDFSRINLFLMGIAYKGDISDDRWSAGLRLAIEAINLDMKLEATDPYAEKWTGAQIANQYDATNWAHNRKNIEALKNVRFDHQPEEGGFLDSISPEKDIFVLSAPHTQYYSQNHPEERRTIVDSEGNKIVFRGLDVVHIAARMLGLEGRMILDTFDYLTDEDYRKLLALGWHVSAMGKGHIGRLEQELTLEKRIKAVKELIAELERLSTKEVFNTITQKRKDKNKEWLEREWLEEAIKAAKAKLDYFRAGIAQRIEEVEEKISQVEMEVREAMPDESIERVTEDLKVMKESFSFLREEQGYVIDASEDYLKAKYELLKARQDARFTTGLEKETFKKKAEYHEHQFKALSLQRQDSITNAEEINEANAAAEKADQEYKEARKKQRITEISAIAEKTVEPLQEGISQRSREMEIASGAFSDTMEEFGVKRYDYESEDIGRELKRDYIGYEYMYDRLGWILDDYDRMYETFTEEQKEALKENLRRRRRRPHLGLSGRSVKITEELKLYERLAELEGIELTQGEGIAVQERQYDPNDEEDLAQDQERLQALKEVGIYVIYKDEIEEKSKDNSGYAEILSKLETDGVNVRLTQMTEAEKKRRESIVIQERPYDPEDLEAENEDKKRISQLKKLGIYVIYKDSIINPQAGQMLDFVPFPMFAQDKDGKIVLIEDPLAFSRARTIKWRKDAEGGKLAENELADLSKIVDDLEGFLLDLSKNGYVVKKEDIYVITRKFKKIDDVSNFLIDEEYLGENPDKREKKKKQIFEYLQLCLSGKHKKMNPLFSKYMVKIPLNMVRVANDMTVLLHQGRIEIQGGREGIYSFTYKGAEYAAFVNKEGEVISVRDNQGEDVSEQFSVNASRDERFFHHVDKRYAEMGRVEFKDGKVYTFILDKDYIVYMKDGKVEEIRTFDDDVVTERFDIIQEDNEIIFKYQGDKNIIAQVNLQEGKVGEITFGDGYRVGVKDAKVDSILNREGKDVSKAFYRHNVRAAAQELYEHYDRLPYEFKTWMMDNVFARDRILSTLKGEKQSRYYLLMDVNLDTFTAARGRGGIPMQAAFVSKGDFNGVVSDTTALMENLRGIELIDKYGVIDQEAFRALKGPADLKLEGAFDNMLIKQKVYSIIADQKDEPIIVETENGAQQVLMFKASGHYQEMDPMEVKEDTKRVIQGGRVEHDMYTFIDKQSAQELKIDIQKEGREEFPLAEGYLGIVVNGEIEAIKDEKNNDVTDQFSIEEKQEGVFEIAKKIAVLEMYDGKLVEIPLAEGYRVFIRSGEIDLIKDAEGKDVSGLFTVESPEEGYFVIKNKEDNKDVGWIRMGEDKSAEFSFDQKYTVRIQEGEIRELRNEQGENILETQAGLRHKTETRTSKTQMGQVKGLTRQAAPGTLLMQQGTEAYNKGWIARAPYRAVYTFYGNPYSDQEYQLLWRTVPSPRTGWMLFGTEEDFDPVAMVINMAYMHAQIVGQVFTQEHIAPNPDNLYGFKADYEDLITEEMEEEDIARLWLENLDIISKYMGWYTDEDSQFPLANERDPKGAMKKYFGYYMQLTYWDYIGGRTSNYDTIELHHFHYWVKAFFTYLLNMDDGAGPLIHNKEKFQRFLEIKEGDVTKENLEEFEQDLMETLWKEYRVYHVLKNRLTKGYDPTMNSTYAESEAKYRFDPNDKKKAEEFIDKQEELLRAAQRLIEEEDYPDLYAEGEIFNFEDAFKELEKKRRQIEILSQQEKIESHYLDIYMLPFYKPLEPNVYSTLNYEKIRLGERSLRFSVRFALPTALQEKRDISLLKTASATQRRMNDMMLHDLVDRNTWKEFAFIPGYFKTWFTGEGPEDIAIIDENKPEEVYRLMQADYLETRQQIHALPKDIDFSGDTIQTEDGFYFHFTTQGETWYVKVELDLKETFVINKEQYEQEIKPVVEPVVVGADASMLADEIALEQEEILLHYDREPLREHTLNGINMALALGKHFGLPKEDMLSLWEGYLPHDLGKKDTDRALAAEINEFCEAQRKAGNERLHNRDRYLLEQLEKEGKTITPDVLFNLDKEFIERLKEAGFPVEERQEEIEAIASSMFRHEMAGWEILEELDKNGRLQHFIVTSDIKWLILYHTYPKYLPKNIPGYDRIKRLLDLLKIADSIDRSIARETLDRTIAVINRHADEGQIEQETADEVIALLADSNSELRQAISMAHENDTEKVKVSIEGFLKNAGVVTDNIASEEDNALLTSSIQQQEFFIDGSYQRGEVPEIDVSIQKKEGTDTVIVCAHGLMGYKDGGISPWLKEMEDVDASVVTYTSSRFRPHPGKKIDEPVDYMFGKMRTEDAKTFEQEADDLRRVINFVIQQFGEDVKIIGVASSLSGQYLPTLAWEFPQVKHILPLVGSMQTFSKEGRPKEKTHELLLTPSKEEVGQQFSRYKGPSTFVIAKDDMPERNESIREWGEFASGPVRFIVVKDDHGLKKNPETKESIQNLIREVVDDVQSNDVAMMATREDTDYWFEGFESAEAIANDRLATAQKLNNLVDIPEAMMVASMQQMGDYNEFIRTLKAQQGLKAIDIRVLPNNASEGEGQQAIRITNDLSELFREIERLRGQGKDVIIRQERSNVRYGEDQDRRMTFNVTVTNNFPGEYTVGSDDVEVQVGAKGATNTSIEQGGEILPVSEIEKEFFFSEDPSDPKAEWKPDVLHPEEYNELKETAKMALKGINLGLSPVEQLASAEVKIEIEVDSKGHKRFLVVDVNSQPKDMPVEFVSVETKDIPDIIMRMIDEDLDESHARLLTLIEDANIYIRIIERLENYLKLKIDDSDDPLLLLKQARAIIILKDILWKLKYNEERIIPEDVISDANLKNLISVICWGRDISLDQEPTVWEEDSMAGRILSALQDKQIIDRGYGDLEFTNAFLMAANEKDMQDAQRSREAIMKEYEELLPETLEYQEPEEGNSHIVLTPVRGGAISSANGSDAGYQTKLLGIKRGIGGKVLNFAADIDGKAPFRTEVKRLQEPKLVLEIVGGLPEAQDGMRLELTKENIHDFYKYQDPNVKDSFDMLKHALVFSGIVKEDVNDPEKVLRDIEKFMKGGGLQLRIVSYAPSHSGLGTSSAVALSLLKALYMASGQNAIAEDVMFLCSLAQIFEISRGLKSGLQEVHGEAIPAKGLKEVIYTFNPADGYIKTDLEEHVRIVEMDDRQLQAFNENMLWVKLGVPRPKSKDIRRGLNRRYFEYLSRGPAFLALLKSLGIHDRIVEAFESENWALLGDLFLQYVALRERIDPFATRSLYDDELSTKHSREVQLLREAGDSLVEAGLIHGWMLIGAMGGGTAMMVLTEKGKELVDVGDGKFKRRAEAALEEFERLKDGLVSKEEQPLSEMKVFNLSINTEGVVHITGQGKSFKEEVAEYHRVRGLPDAVELILISEEEEGSDNAALATPLGGIDFNPAMLDMQIKRDGKGIPLPINQQSIQDMKIEGFLPVIINITPVSNFPFLLGIADQEEESKDLGYHPSLDPMDKIQSIEIEHPEQVSLL